MAEQLRTFEIKDGKIDAANFIQVTIETIREKNLIYEGVLLTII